MNKITESRKIQKRHVLQWNGFWVSLSLGMWMSGGCLVIG